MDRYFYHFVKKHAFDRQTDGRMDRQNSHLGLPRLHSMQHGKNNMALFSEVYVCGTNIDNIKNKKSISCVNVAVRT